MKKLIILILLLFGICGCWNYKELDDYSIITGIAIDKNEDKYEVSVLISNASKSSGESPSSSESQGIVYSGKGNSIFKALKDISLVSPKELYLDHFSILVLSEEVAKEGIYNIVDFFLRYPNARKDFSVALAKDCKAKDTLKIVTPLTDFPSQSIADNLNFSSELQGAISNLNYNELIYSLIAPGKEVTVNGIKIVGNEKEGSKKENTESSEPKTYLKLYNLGVFKSDKFIKWTTEEESYGINIINNKVSEMYIKIKFDDGYVVISPVDFSSKINIKFKDNKPIISINTSGNAKVMEVNGHIDLEDDSVIKEIEKKSNKKIKNYIEKAIKVAKENNTDIFGFGLKLYKSNPDYFDKVKNDWNENLKDLKINIKNELIIKSISSTQNSVEVLDDKE